MIPRQVAHTPAAGLVLCSDRALYFKALPKGVT